MTANCDFVLLVPVLLALSAGCNPSGSDGQAVPTKGVTVRILPSRGRGGFGAGLARPELRVYGPGLRYSRLGDILEPEVFEVTNHGPGAVGWVAWTHAHSYAVPWERARHGQRPSSSETDPRKRPDYDYVTKKQPLAVLGPLPPGSTVLVARPGGKPGWGEGEAGPTWRVPGSGPPKAPPLPPESRVMPGSVRWGRAGSPPREAGILVPYTGPAWLAATGKFSRERLDALLAELPGAGAEARERILWSLAWSSQYVNGRLPLVKKPEIVAAFVAQVLKAKPTAVPVVPADEEPPKTPRAFDAFRYSLLVLLDLVPAAELRKHADALAPLSAHAADRRVVELLVKAGSAKVLKELATKPDRLPKEGREDLVLAVKAASGDEKAFASLLEAFASEKTPARKVALGRLLALVGREEGLKAVAGELRDAREYTMNGTRVVFCELADALRLACPEERSLYVNFDCTRDERVEFEEFCTKRFGVKYPGELPPEPGATSTPDADKALEKVKAE